ncbi:thiamine diphosphokinase [Tenacibaculum maritimum]|uniref:thiamine diphosphokinase n=1 Tax=Tenacibaculum maritimum TaxID=107401 RepID=UPI0012E50810|nr:thiamine diphosphokinase [Tenacibaculum maritimum]CAA0197677.1 Thiamine pyrophosphokinase [Tenacibaculum maritimum]
MKSSQKVFLLLNGEPPNGRPNLSKYDFICATDGAYHVLEKLGIVPDLVAGDLDSSSNHLPQIELIHTPNQDFTDFDKILRILYERGYKKVDVFGASGKEQDHFLGNLQTALMWKENLVITFFDAYSKYFFADYVTNLQNVKGKTISLVPFPSAEGIITKGLQYPLHKEALSFGTRIGTRNKAIEKNVEIRFEVGDLVIFVNN